MIVLSKNLFSLVKSGTLYFCIKFQQPSWSINSDHSSLVMMKLVSTLLVCTDVQLYNFTSVVKLFCTGKLFGDQLY